MMLPPKNIVSCFVLGPALHAARVAIGPTGARVVANVRVDDFLSLSQADAKSALKPVAGSGRVVLTADPSWCAVRPIALTTQTWAKAKSELMQSIDRLVPMTRDDALAGLIDVHDESLKPREGRLIAIRKQLLEPWRQAIEHALDAPVSAVLSPHMAMCGLGLQTRESATVFEPLGGGEALRHDFAFGLPTEIAEAAGDESAHQFTVMSAGVRRTISGDDLAIGAAVAPYVATSAFAPLLGAAPSRRSEWIAPIAAFAAAAALFIAAPLMYEARLQSGVDRLEARQVAMVDDFQSLRELRNRTEQRIKLVNEAVATATTGWRSTLPILAEAQAALPADGFLYRLEIDPQNVVISGEASDAPAVLQRLEESPLLTSARRTGPLMPSSEPGLDIFEMRAALEAQGETP